MSFADTQNIRGKRLYFNFGTFLSAAIRAKDGNMCAVLLPSLVWLIVQEEGNLWGSPSFAGRWNYNTMGEIAVDALKVAYTEGYPSYLEDGVAIARKRMEDLDLLV